MKSMDEPVMRFLFGDRELLLVTGDLLSAQVDVIVNPANRELLHHAGLAQHILEQAGNQLQHDSEQLIREYGPLETGMAVYTSAGSLPFKAVIHAVAPSFGEGDEQRKLEQAVSRSLQLCEMNEWRSIGFPAIGTGSLAIPAALCAQAFYRAITRFWDARHDCSVEKVIVYLRQAQFRPFFDAFREHGISDESDQPAAGEAGSDEPVGHVELSETDIAELDDTEISKWFK
jgi:O-acetyl-ADP-ribose deacetylase (regulator of RNase III)